MLILGLVADHLRKFFMRNLQFDAYASQVFLAELARQLQQRLAQSLFCRPSLSRFEERPLMRASAIAYCSRWCFPQTPAAVCVERRDAASLPHHSPVSTLLTIRFREPPGSIFSSGPWLPLTKLIG